MIELFLSKLVSMRTFDGSSNLREDDCAVLAQNVQNNRIVDYNLYNNYDLYCKTTTRQDAQAFSLDNFRSVKEGYGEPSACVIDEETNIIKSALTHPRGRIALEERVFHDVPYYLGRGLPQPEEEMRIKLGDYQYERKMCASNVELSVDRFDPLLPCIRETIANPVNTASMSNNIERIGAPTRDVDFQKRFLRQQGYDYNGKFWNKKYCSAPTPRRAATS